MKPMQLELVMLFIMEQKVSLSDNFQIDKEDEDLLRFSWHKKNEKGYIHSLPTRIIHGKKKQTEMILHREIMERILQRKLRMDERVYFQDNDKENNTRANLTLRNVHTYQKKKKSERSSQYAGICLRSSGKWRATLYHEKKAIHVGLYNNELDAVRARNKKSLELFGDTRKLQTIKGEEREKKKVQKGVFMVLDIALLFYAKERCVEIQENETILLLFNGGVSTGKVKKKKKNVVLEFADQSCIGIVSGMEGWYESEKKNTCYSC
jgi:hypothetical protein